MRTYVVYMNSRENALNSFQNLSNTSIFNTKKSLGEPRLKSVD